MSDTFLIQQATIVDECSPFYQQTLDVAVTKGVITNIAERIEKSGNIPIVIADGLYLSQTFVDLYARAPVVSDDVVGVSSLHMCASSSDLENLPQEIRQRIRLYADMNQYNQLCAHFDKEYVALTNNKPFADSRALLQIMRYCASVDLPIYFQPMEPSLSQGDMFTHSVTWRLGYNLIDSNFEHIDIYRIAHLAADAGCRLHFGLISTKKGVDLIRQLKQTGMNISADVAIANLVWSLDDINTPDAHHKSTPPLTTRGDQLALLQALCDGTIDAIVSNHTLVSLAEKDNVVDHAPFGIETLPYMLGLLSYLAQKHSYALGTVLAWFSSRPACLFGNKSCIDVGQPAQGLLFAPQNYPLSLSLPLVKSELQQDKFAALIMGGFLVR